MPLPPDLYPDLDTLKRSLRENRDYRIRLLDRKAEVTVIAPHGGHIDVGTSAVARAIAGSQHNLFDFQGLRARDSFDLHVTSTRFRDPQLTALLAGSAFALSVHCMGDEDDTTIWLGGLNKELKQIVHDKLVAAGFSLNTNSPRHRGESAKNVVNLAQAKGVQLEIPRNLMRSFFRGKRLFVARERCPKTTARFDLFVQAVRAAIREYQAKRQQQ